jgi:hypothetical protein
MERSRNFRFLSLEEFVALDTSAQVEYLKRACAMLEQSRRGSRSDPGRPMREGASLAT